jgi:heat shock protein HslJ
MTLRLAALAFALATLALPARADLAGEVPQVLRLQWSLAEVDGQPATYSATLSLGDDGRISGQAPCNRYFGGVDGALPDFRPTGLGATRMACDQLAQEQAYLTLLQGADRLTWSDRELHISGAGHVLVFRRPLD